MQKYFISECCANAAHGDQYLGTEIGWAYYTEYGELETATFNYCPFCGKKLELLGRGKGRR